MGHDEEPTGGSEGSAAPERKRPRSLSGAYLEEALVNLHDAGNPRVLYGVDSLPTDKTATAVVMLNGRTKHVARCRNAVLFAAFAAEAYVNEFLAVYLSRKDRDALDRLSTVEKYVVGTRTAYGKPLFNRGRPPIPTLDELFKLRNRLVHPKPGFGPGTLIEPSDEFDQLFAPSTVASHIVNVAGTASALIQAAHGSRMRIDPWADVVWFGREAIFRFAAGLTSMPATDADPGPPLFRQALDVVTVEPGAEAEQPTSEL